MSYTKEQYTWIAIRLLMGWIWFWAFIDKLFGLGFATAPENSWLAGGSPTAGFLGHATTGPLAPFYQSLAGSPIIDVLFMGGLFFVGITLLSGIAVRLGSYAGMLMAFLMYTALLLPANNPIVDEHVLYILVFLALSQSKAGRWFGLGNWWSKHGIVKRNKILE